MSAWTEAKNNRRYNLIIRKYSDEGLSSPEVDELARLQAEMIAHRQRVAPLPIREAARFLKELSETK